MAVFEIEIGGKVYEAEAPNAEALQAQLGQPGFMGALNDMIGAGASGIAKGVVGLPGLFGDVQALASEGAAMAGKWAGFDVPRDPSMQLPTSQDVIKGVEGLTGEFYKPKTTAGKYAQTIGEFVPGMAIPGGGGVASRFAKFAAIPGAASESAGQYTAGTPYEPFARAGAGILAGGLAASAGGRTANSAIRGAVPDNITPAQLQAAENLFQEAQALGIPITRAEAVQAATGGATRLADLQRVVEGQGGMRDFFSQRPAQTEAAFARTARDIDPVPTNAPSTIGPQVGRAAAEEIGDVRRQINDAARPFYSAAERTLLNAQEMARVRALPGYQQAVDAIRRDPQLARYADGLPENSVGFLNEVKKYMDQAGTNASSRFNPDRNAQRGAGWERDAGSVRQAGIDASQNYEIALGVESRLRRDMLEPLLQGPLGKLAKKDLPTRQAIEALFPRNPLPNSADEITIAIGALARRNPNVARQLVGAHAESVFNEAARRFGNSLSQPMNEFGGPKFAAAIRGNPQQAANLEAAVRALPNGDRVWAGFDRFLTIMEAQGTRQRIGTQTAFNQEVLQDLRRGTAAQEGATIASGLGLTWPARVRDALERWRLGRNVDEIARLLTDPRAGRAFQQLASATTGSQISAAFTRLVYMTYAGSEPQK